MRTIQMYFLICIVNMHISFYVIMRQCHTYVRVRAYENFFPADCPPLSYTFYMLITPMHTHKR